MPIKRLTVSAALVSVLFLSGSLYATDSQAAGPPIFGTSLAATVAAPLLHPLPASHAVPGLGQSLLPDTLPAMLTNTASSGVTAVGAANANANAEEAPSTASTTQQNVTDLRKALLAAAMSLRDTRYVRGGRSPSTGFDCSGFVRYVFAHAIGLQLPSTSATQFLAGVKVRRADIKPGDLVFFHTHGKHRISHVGIYISNGRFIHSPATGKSVEISSLDDSYWARRFAGAKRPEAMTLAANRG